MVPVTVLRTVVRRAALCAALVAVATPFLHVAFQNAGLPVLEAAANAALVALLLCAALGGVALLATTRPALRGLRVIAECGAIAVLATAVTTAFGPPSSLAAMALGLVGFGLLVHSALYGSLAAMLPRVTQRDRARSHVPLPPELLWRMALPTRPSEHWDPLLRRAVQDVEDADTFHLEYARPGGGLDAVTVTFLEIEPERGYRYLFQGDAVGAGFGFVQGDQRLRMAPDGEGGTWIEVERVTEQRTLGQLLLSVLDRGPQDHVDFLRAVALGEGLDGTLAGAHREAVLGQRLGAGRRRAQTGSTSPSARSAWNALCQAAKRPSAIAARMPAMISW